MTTKPKALPPVEELWELYKQEGSVHRVKDRIGVCHSRIHKALVDAGYRLNGSKFSKEDDEIIKQYYTNTHHSCFDLQSLADTLKRTNKTNVSRRARELGLSDRKRPMSKASRDKISVKAKARLARDGHPKGFLGRKHSDAALKIISNKSIAAWERMTPEEKQQKILKMLKTRSKNGTLVNRRATASWKAGWRNVGGKRCYFRSRWEANYARYLQCLLETKQIKSWEYEPETFWFKGVKRGVVSYLPDFRVTENDGSSSYHEVKGWMDSKSKTKIRRMGKYHPDITLIVIDANAYRDLERKVKSFVKEWEL